MSKGAPFGFNFEYKVIFFSVMSRGMVRQTGGGSYLQPMGKYIDGPGPIPAAAGGDLLRQTNDLIARPQIENTAFRGGFVPSIMKGVINAGAVTVPAALVAGRRMFTASRKGGGRKGDTWAAQRAEAKGILERYGVPNGTNISAFASRYFEGRKKYDRAAAAQFLRDFQDKVQRGERKQTRNRSVKRRVQTPAAAPRRSVRTIRAPNRLTYPKSNTTTRKVSAARIPVAPRPTRTRRNEWQAEQRRAMAALKQRGLKANVVQATRLAKHRREQRPNEAFFAQYDKPVATMAVMSPPTPPPAATKPILRESALISRIGRLNAETAEERRLIAKRALQSLGIQPSATNIQRYVKALKAGLSREEMEALESNILYRKSQTKKAKKTAMTARPSQTYNLNTMAEPYEFIEPENE
jgi:hypothetical protein